MNRAKAVTLSLVEQLGRLEPLDPRVVWQREAGHFTPWLLANADRLAEALGIDLELDGAEHAVGGYSLTRSCAPSG